jgi:hypothetical protein
MEKKKRITVAVYGIVTAAILVGSYLAINIAQHVIAQSNPISQNATSSGTASGNTTTAGGGSQGVKK